MEVVDDEFDFIDGKVSLQIGDQVKKGRYTIIGEIGEGGFGKVYLVEDNKNNKERYTDKKQSDVHLYFNQLMYIFLY